VPAKSVRARRDQGLADIIFHAVNYSFMIILCITTLYPFYFLMLSSFSLNDVSVSGICLFPKEFTFGNFSRVFANPLIATGYRNTILRTVIGTALSVLVTFMLAYPLAKRRFPNRDIWTGIIVFTMFFSGGLIPSYLLVRSLGLIDSIWSLILPELVSAYNFVIVRNYIMAIPPSMEESAKMDGANDIIILFRIIMPICKPVLATIALWIAVGHWNAWFDSLLYMTKASGQVVQLVMRRIVLEGSDAITQMIGQDTTQSVTPEGLKGATIVVTMVPILALYPFIQKYFVKGVMVGSLKG
jgi:putative aldouronate transport system permease protein